MDGTGTGIWAIDMADTYPAAQVIGTDLSPVQPIFVPPNCRFEVDDFELDWYAEQSLIDHERATDQIGHLGNRGSISSTHVSSWALCRLCQSCTRRYLPH